MARKNSRTSPMRPTPTATGTTAAGTLPLEKGKSLCSRWSAGPRGYLFIGGFLLLAWATWWGASVRQPLPHLLPGRNEIGGKRFTSMLIMPFLGLAFHPNYLAARLWREGGHPYTRLPGDPSNLKYTYPPLTLRAFW